ncbi:hypothetical protein LTR08_001304 [Meristemomyces frigidus]|nr:hypothetical protein LTR08_001304 [Meristemomyces frigidus]
MLRRSTKGPLDAPDESPLATAAAASPTTSASELTSPTGPADTPSAASPPAVSALPHRPKPKVDLSFLQDPNIYHALPTEDVATAFLESEQQPPPETQLAGLLQNGHFRRAAERATTGILKCTPDDAEQIFQLMYTRLACVILLSRPDLAAQEAAPLTDLLARNSPGAKDIMPLVPWELRLLTVRLQSIGAVDGGRRGIMALYGLSAEIRAHLRQAKADEDEAEQRVWASRLQDLGLRVADALVEMGELETANRHLETLTKVDADDIISRRALLSMRMGDIAGARTCLKSLQHDDKRAAFDVLLKVADGDFSGAAETWQGLTEQQPSHAIFANNLAVSLLYTGHITSSQDILEEAAERLPGFSSMLFNLSTVYELCTERAVDLKTSLAYKMAAKAPRPETGGWERATLDFKL